MTSQNIDISSLPAHTIDSRSPIWWGNLLLLLIESVMFALLIGSYFYLARNFSVWPPPRTIGFPPEYRSAPQLGWATANLIVILLGVLPMLLADRASLRLDKKRMCLGMILVVLFGLAEIGLRWKEFGALNMRWDDNAYASITWMILGMHFTHLIVATLESLLLTAWLLTHGVDDQHARDTRVSAVYWYWIAAVWVLLYLLVYFGPRWL